MEPVGIWEWFFVLLVFGIPVINVIVFLIYACGAGKQSLVNFCRAGLVWLFLATVLIVIALGSG